MKLYSTNNPEWTVSLDRAVMEGLAPDRGLYMPLEIPQLPSSFWSELPDLSIADIGFVVCQTLFQGFIPDEDLRGILDRSMNFPAPLFALDGDTSVLELFHGPSLAFKDFGARFMAELMGYFNQKEEDDLYILVATSGDTGGAVAAGFYDVPGIKVCILYPSGRVSSIQEKQLTTLRKNITALEVRGSFDDCQRMVKDAFLDTDFNSRFRLSSANSINIARLIPQSFYYIEAYRQLLIRHGEQVRKPVFVVPSGNFGNLTAGVLAYKMGLPVERFVAATNANHVVPSYLENGVFSPIASVSTISNAMDVGDPSNFPRLKDLFNASVERSTWNLMRECLSGYWYTDRETKTEISRVYEGFSKYILDPHTAVGLLAMNDYRRDIGFDGPGVVLGTAHFGKFLPVINDVLGFEPTLPDELEQLRVLEKESVLIENNYMGLKSAFLARFT